VGVERADLVDTPDRPHADRSDLAELADVAPHLVGAVHPAPDELELGMGEHTFDRLFADESGGPLNDAIGHAMILADDARLARVARGLRPSGESPGAPPRGRAAGHRSRTRRRAARAAPGGAHVRG